MREIGRLLRPGGRVAFTGWVFAEPHRPTVVADYRPLLEAEGFTTQCYETFDSAARERFFFEAVLERADDLRAEIGASAEPLVQEAEATMQSERDGTRRPRSRVLLSAVKTT